MIEVNKEISENLNQVTPLKVEECFSPTIDRAPKRKPNLTQAERALAIKNVLRYFPPAQHEELIPEFLNELQKWGKIYCYRLHPKNEIKARAISDYSAKSSEAAAIMLMIQNNLDHAVAQHPYELITYGGNGSVFQNWAQYRLVMKYLSEMTSEQTLVLNSGHPLGLFPSHKNSPRVVVVNGLMIPNYSQRENYEKLNALGVTQYGQMTAGSFMYIGPQGIVHGTAITLMNAARLQQKKNGFKTSAGMLFLSSGLGGMSGAQGKAAKIAGLIGVVAEVNASAAQKRLEQGWVDELFHSTEALIKRIHEAKKNKEACSLAYVGNVVDLWKEFYHQEISIDIASDQSSLHNPFSGGYYPVGKTFEESRALLESSEEAFKKAIQDSLKEHVLWINKHTQERGTYFFDYGNAFLLEAGRAGADVFNDQKKFKYNSYVQDILGPLCFDYGFGPFRWVCASGDPEDLKKTDLLAQKVLKKLLSEAPQEIRGQLEDNLKWIQEAQKNKLVVGSQARILYADADGRVEIAKAFNEAIARGEISSGIILGRDHHDVSGTDSPFRETSNIYDASSFTADMAVQNFVGDAIRGATWVSLHNGGGVGWGEVINGGFGMFIDGSEESRKKIESMLFWDVMNGVTRRAWAGNKGAQFVVKNKNYSQQLQVTEAQEVDPELLNRYL